MNRKVAYSFFLWLFSLLIAVNVIASEPKLIRSIPADGATNVPLQQGKIILYFDQNMKMNSWSLMQTESHPFPPIKSLDEPWRDPLTFVLVIKELKPNTVYSLQLNSEKRKGFASAESQTPLPITTITFSTGSGISQTPQKKGQIAQGKNKDWRESNEEMRSREPMGPAEGWKVEVTRSTGLEGTETYQNGYQAPFRIFQKIIFQQTVTKTAQGTIMEAERTVRSAQFHTLNPHTGQMMPQEIAPVGMRLRIQHNLHGSTLIDADSGQRIWDEDLVSAFATPLAPRLWPEGELKQGQRWSYEGADLVRRIALLDALGGRIDLAVQRIEPEPSSGIMTAFIRGKLKTKVDLDPVILDFDANVSIDLPVPIKIPFMVKFEGKLFGNGSVVDDRGQKVTYRIEAQGSLLQIAKPENRILDAFTRGEVLIEKGKIGPQGQVIIPAQKKTP